MPNNELSLDQVLNMDLKPLEQVADSEAKYKKNLERFNFDPSVSIADEIEIQRQEEIEQIKAKAQKQKATQNFIYQNESNARIGSDDIDGLNGIASSLNSLSGVKNLSINSMESKLIDINADKVGGVFKSIAENLNRQNAVSRAQEKTSAFGQLKSFDKTKKPENTISPVKNNGNKYLNAVKRGSASIIQLGSLLYDGGYEAFERGADLVTGFDVNGRSPYKTNRVFNAMQELKQEKYKQSDSFNNLMFGSEIAGAEAKESGNNETIASLQYLAKNGSLGDAGEVLAEFIPSLYLGAGIGSLAGKGAGSLAGSYVSNSVGRSIATNSIINPTRLAAIEVLTPRVVQGAVMAGSSDFIGSMATETEFQKQSYSDSEAVSRALTRSLAQAGVSALGGSLLPLRVGGDLATVSTQAAIQGLAGYASGYAGAKSIGEEYSSTEAAMNILVGAITALPEVVMVGGLSVNKADIQTHLDDLIVDRAIANVTNQQETEESRSSYFGANVRDLISRVKSSKTNQRSPGTVREFIRSAQNEDAAVQTEAFIDAETFNQLSTEYNIDLESLFNTYPELSREYQRANEIDGVIRMSLDEMAIAFSQVDNEQYLNAFSDSLRHHPEAMTAGEARAEFSKNTEEMKADIQEIKQKFENEKVKIKELKTVSDIIGNDLSNLNFKFSADYNNQAKALVSAFYETLADKTGVSAMDLYQSMPLRVVSTQDQANAINNGNVDEFNQSKIDLDNAIDKELIAIHEIKTDGLIHADRMGGLAVPSLGVVKKGHLTSGFGEITLIAPTTMIDPKGYAKPKVYGADIYSPRYPDIEYKLDRKGVESFNNSLDASRDFMESKRNFSSEDLTSRPHRTLMDSPEVAHKFLTDQGVTVQKVYKNEIVKKFADNADYQMPLDLWTNILQDSSLNEVGDLIDLDGNFDSASILNKLMENPEQLKRVYDGFIKAKTERQVLKSRAERTRTILEQADSQAQRRFLYDAFEDLKNILNGKTPKPEATETVKQVFDHSATIEAVRKSISENSLEGEFREYVDSIVAKTMTHERLRNGYTPSGNPRYSEHNLDNVVKILKKDLVGGESFNYGLGSIRSHYTPELKSLSQIKNHADKLVSTEEFSKVKDKVNSIYSDLQEKVNEFGTFDGWDNFDLMLKDVPKIGIEKALNQNGFKSVPDKIKGEIGAFLKTLADMPTEYFEAKITRAVNLNEFAGAVVPKTADKKTIDALKKNGITDIRFYDESNPREKVIESFAEAFFQKRDDEIRGQIQFRKDKKGAVIILSKDANFSTFAHEIGHHFLEMSMSFATRPDAPEQLKADMIKVMEWSKQGKGIEGWKNLSPEQKTEVHEKFAETFEQYMFTGKAPSNELRKVFSRFRSFMASVYGNIQKFLGVQSRADLNPEIRDVMDRMLASQEAIEQVQKQRNLEFALTEEQATQMGISPKDYLIMVDEHKEATEKAINELEQRTLKDLARYRTLRNKHVKAFSEQQKRVRQQTREKVAEEVAQMPVYQALAFLRQPVERPEKVKRDPNVVDPKIDTLLEAIAKMGGINSKEIESTWGVDQPESYKANVGRVKKIARKDGLSIETVAERLASDGYLKTDENGKLDIHEFENLFSDSLAGGKYYSNQADHDLFMMGDDYGLAWGQIDEFPVSGKLNIEALKARYGEESEIYKAVAKTGQYGLAMKDGLDPDLVASQFGYESGDALIKDLANAPTPKEVIEQRSNELIQARDSDLFDDQSIEMAIDEAVHNDIRAMMLARELTAITQLKGRQSEFNETAKAMAQNIIDKSLVTEIRPHLFSSADLRHAKAYDKALKAGDTTGAVRAKRQQLINFHATKQAYEANRFIDKLFDLSKTINGNDAKLAKARDFNLVAISRYILNLYGVSDNPSNFVEHIENLKKYDPTAASQISDLFYMKDAEGNTVPRIEIKDYTEMTFEEFSSLNDMVRQIWHKSKESQKIKVGDERIEFTKVVDDLVSSTNKKPTKSRAGSFLGYTPRKAGDFNPQRAFQTLKRAEQLFTWLDGGKSNGFFHKYVFNPMQDSLTSYRLEQKKMMQEMVNIYSEFDVVHGKIDASELGGDRTTFESKQELLHAILHTGNESNKSRLVQGFGWGEKLDDGSVDYSKWDSFIGRMFDEGVITKKDMDSIQKIWNLFDGYKEQAQRVHKNLNGLYFKELPKSKVITPFGEYEGGYIPADYDRLRSAEAEQRGKANASTDDAPFYNGGASTGANFTKSRVESYRGDYMTLDMSQLPLHLDRELRYIHLEENLKQASKIFRNKDVMSGIESVSPFAIDAIISDWLGAVANQRVSKPSSMPTFDRFVEKAKQNSGIVLMAGNIKNAVEAWTSIPQLTIAVPKKELASTSAKFFVDLASRESMTKQVRELSPFMNSRLDRSVNEMRYQLEGIVTNPSAFKKGSDFLKQNAYFVQQVFQTPLETIGWMSAFNDAQTKGMSEADAIHHADGIVRMYLNDMSPEGISKVERGNALQRAMLMFYGWFNMVHNTFSMNKNLISETSELGNLKKYGQYAGLYVMMIAMPAMLSKALTLSFNGELFNNEDAEDWSDDLVNITVKSQAEMIFGMMPFARDIINPIYRSTFNATIYSDRYSVSPIQSMAENLVKLGKTLYSSGENIFADGENDIDKSKFTKELLQGATFATGVPFTLVQRPTVYGVDVLVDEDQEPENIADAVRGTLNGR